MADSYTSFGPADVLIPFASKWHPVAVAWGIVGMYLLVAVEVTSLARKHLPKKLWKRTHFLSFPLWFTASVHLLTAGTESTNPVLLGTVAAVTVTVAVLTLRRVITATRGGSRTGSGRTPARTPRAPAQRPAPQPRPTPRPAAQPVPQFAPQYTPQVQYPSGPPTALAPQYAPQPQQSPQPQHAPQPQWAPGVPPPYPPR